MTLKRHKRETIAALALCLAFTALRGGAPAGPRLVPAPAAASVAAAPSRQAEDPPATEATAALVDAAAADDDGEGHGDVADGS